MRNVDYNGFLYVSHITIDPETDLSKRRVTSILDIIGQIGGVYKMIFLAGTIFTAVFNENLYNYSMLSNLYQVDLGYKKDKDTLNAGSSREEDKNENESESKQDESESKQEEQEKEEEKTPSKPNPTVLINPLFESATQQDNVSESQPGTTKSVSRASKISFFRQVLYNLKNRK